MRIFHDTLFSFFQIVNIMDVIEGKRGTGTADNIIVHNTTTHSVGNTSAGIKKVVQFGPHCPKKLLPR